MGRVNGLTDGDLCRACRRGTFGDIRCSDGCGSVFCSPECQTYHICTLRLAKASITKAVRGADVDEGPAPAAVAPPVPRAPEVPAAPPTERRSLRGYIGPVVGAAFAALAMYRPAAAPVAARVAVPASLEQTPEAARVAGLRAGYVAALRDLYVTAKHKAEDSRLPADWRHAHIVASEVKRACDDHLPFDASGITLLETQGDDNGRSDWKSAAVDMARSATACIAGVTDGTR